MFNKLVLYYIIKILVFWYFNAISIHTLPNKRTKSINQHTQSPQNELKQTGNIPVYVQDDRFTTVLQLTEDVYFFFILTFFHYQG